MEKLCLTVAEAKKLTGIGNNNIYALLNSNEIPNFKIGAKYFIPVATLQKWLEQKCM